MPSRPHRPHPAPLREGEGAALPLPLGEGRGEGGATTPISPVRHVACLHTAASNVAIFDADCPPGLRLHHAVRPDLLAEAEREGGLTEALAQRTAAALLALADDISVILLTCSTLGPAVARASAAAVPVLRADALLADVTSQVAGPIFVLCAAPTTLAPTAALFGHRGHGTVEVMLVDAAWTSFRAGDLSAYHQCIAAAADAAFAAGAAMVALAQASMAPAAALCRRGVPLTIPAAALQALV